MRRREFVALMGASVTWPFAAKAQQAGRTYRLGALYATPRNDAVVPVFFEALRRLGFIESQNLTVDYRDAYAQHIEKLSEWAAELVKARVDVIATVGDLGIRAAHNKDHSDPCHYGRYGWGRTSELDGSAKWKYYWRQYSRD
jgi:putative ABC transport system substrate-binding protein